MNRLYQITNIVLKVFVGMASGYYIGLFLYISLSRMYFPITLDWVEGAVVAQADRLLLGQKMYVEPAAAYIPLVYPPVYFYITAFFTKLLGFGLGPARLLSILASCGCIILIFLITRKLTGSSFPGILTGGLFAATNGVVWTWFDFAKVDMLFVFFSLLGLFFLLKTDIRGAVLAGIFFTLSFFTKQSAIIIILPAVFFYFLFINRKLAVVFALTLSLFTLTGFLFLNYDSNGWYYFYVFTLPAYHRLDTNPAQIIYIVTSILEPVMFITGTAFFSILIDLKKFVRDRQFIFFFGVAVVTLVLSIVSALSVGATRNAFIPAYALIAIICGKGFHFAQEKISTFLSNTTRFICSSLLLAVCLLQFSLLQYSSRSYVPLEQDFKEADALLKYLQNTDGEFMIPVQNYMALVVHKKVFFHDAALGEFTGYYGRSLPEGPIIEQEIERIVRSGEVNVIYLSTPNHDWMGLSCEKEDKFLSTSKFVPSFYKMRCG